MIFTFIRPRNVTRNGVTEKILTQKKLIVFSIFTVQ